MTKIHTLLPLEEWVEFRRLKPRRKPPAGMVAREEDLKRFWSKVKMGSPDECWVWTGAISVGYGRFTMLHATIIATHFSLYAHGIKIPHGKEACHICDNPPCVNPNHLFVGARLENIHDCINKGRRPGYNCISREMIQQIRNSTSPSLALASQFGISAEAVRRIRYYRAQYENR
jgi:hypothetical protein